MNMSEGTFTIINDEGKEVVCDILFTFDSKETGKNYVIYTDNTENDEGNTNVYASVYDPSGENDTLMPVETEREWQIIEIVLEELQNEMDGEEDAE